MTSRTLFHSISPRLPQFERKPLSEILPGRPYRPTPSRRIGQQDRSSTSEPWQEERWLQEEVDGILRDRLEASENNERVRKFVTHLCALDTVGLYNAVLALTQNPEATMLLSAQKWWKINFTPKKSAEGVLVTYPQGPVGLMYDIQEVETVPSKQRELIERDKFDVASRHARKVSRCTVNQYELLACVDDRLLEFGLESRYGVPGATSAAEALRFPIELQHGSYYCPPPMIEADTDSNWPFLYFIVHRRHKAAKLPAEASLKEDLLDPRIASSLPEVKYESSEGRKFLLRDKLLGIALASAQFRAPWMVPGSPTFIRPTPIPSKMTPAGLIRESERPLRECPLETCQFEASLALYIVAHRYGWDMQIPLADEFMRSEDCSAPTSANFILVLQIAHFLEKFVSSARNAHPLPPEEA